MNKLWQPTLPQIDTEGARDQVWRPIHYLGSKLRVLPQLRAAFAELAGPHDPICDLFAGSGTVAASLAAEREVIAVDIQEYSRVLCSAVLIPTQLTDTEAHRIQETIFGSQLTERLTWAAPLIEYEDLALKEALQGKPERICDLIEHASLEAGSCMKDPQGARAQVGVATVAGARTRTAIFRYFGGLYFSYRQAIYLDALVGYAHEQLSPLKETLLAVAASAASELVNTVGKQFAQPVRPRDADGKPKRHLIGKIIRDRQLDAQETIERWFARYRSLRPTKHTHLAIRADYADALKELRGKVKLVYADPPYTREHYSRFYHVLETMCLGDEPALSTTRIRSGSAQASRGVYRLDRHQSPFCIRSQAPGAFATLFEGVAALDVPLALSYSPFASAEATHPRVLTIEQLLNIARSYFGSVNIISAGKLSHSKLNATRHHLDAADEAEFIISCHN